MSVALNLLAAVSIQAAAGTQALVPAGDRLDVNTRSGTIRIETWARDEVEITGRHSDAIELEIKSGTTVEIRERRPVRAALEDPEYLIRIPARMSVLVHSDAAHVEISGVRADVDVNVNHGRVEVRDVEGHILLDTTTGDLLIEDSTGDAELDTTAGSVTVRGLSGALAAETVAGAVEMFDVRSTDVRITTNQGDIHFEGPVHPTGVYDLASQRGRVTLRLPGATSAGFEVGTVRGMFSSAFDLGEVEPVTGERFSFAVGGGGARVVIITYSGDIEIGMVGG